MENIAMPNKDHWENVYTTKATDSVSWFQEHARTSLELIQTSGIDLSAAVIDVGGGASTLVDDLLQAGFTQLSVLDLSSAALEKTKDRLGTSANKITWLSSDITQTQFAANRYALWHDRAVFHFLTDSTARAAYKNNLLYALQPKGFLVIATFAEDGPTKCSNLPVMRYSAEELYAEFSSDFLLLEIRREIHKTPFDTTQSFVYCLMQKK